MLFRCETNLDVEIILIKRDECEEIWTDSTTERFTSHFNREYLYIFLPNVKYNKNKRENC